MASQNDLLWQQISKNHRTLILPKQLRPSIISEPFFRLSVLKNHFEAYALYPKNSLNMSIFFQSFPINFGREVTSAEIIGKECHPIDESAIKSLYWASENPQPSPQRAMFFNGGPRFGIKVKVLHYQEVIECNLMMPSEIFGIPAPTIDDFLADELQNAIIKSQAFEFIDPNTKIVWSLDLRNPENVFKTPQHEIKLIKEAADIIDGLQDLSPKLMFRFRDIGGSFGVTARIDLFALIYRGQLKNAEELEISLTLANYPVHN